MSYKMDKNGKKIKQNEGWSKKSETSYDVG